MIIKSEVLAAEYRERAERAFAAADASPLPQVRLRQRFAAAVWLDLAAFQDQRTAHAAVVAAAVAARRLAETGVETATPLHGDIPCTA